MLILASVTLMLICATGIELALGNRSSSKLWEMSPIVDSINEVPLVSVVIPARNEERSIRQALNSVLRQEYPRLEVIVLNDRSEDRTGEILSELSKDEPRLRVISIEQLPPGWLGKNHALYVGAMQAKGQLLLFTDADVVMARTTVSRAVNYLLGRQLDHVAAICKIEASGVALSMFINGFCVFFSSFYKPWRARDPKSRYYIGIGAFNFMRAAVYRQVGTHQAIAMRPDDDMKLGKLIKHHGFRQDVVNAQDLISVRWYASFAELIDGLMKNAFAGTEYRITVTLAFIGATLMLNLWPLFGVALTSGLTRLLNTVTVLVSLLVFWDSARLARFKPWVALGYPFAALTMVYILVRSMMLALIHNGIRWRGTYYPLAALRRNKV